jgi:shikimate kinase
MQRIILLGFMGSGKTTIGKQLAEALNFPFMDSDELIIERTKMSVNEIFNAKGEQAFREMEREVINGLFELPCFILAVGGGLPVIPGMMTRLNELGTTIYLNVSNKELYGRLVNNRLQRPLLKDKTDKELMEQIDTLRSTRETIYLQAHVNLQNDGLTYGDVLETLNLHQKN